MNERQQVLPEAPTAQTLVGIPLPKRTTTLTGRRKYPIDSLEVDQAYWEPLEGRDPKKLQATLRACAANLAKTDPEKFAGRSYRARAHTVDGVDGVGIWRTA